MKTNKKGFTLVELMVVVIIVGILAAVAVPLMTANKDKAIASEAVAAFSGVNTACKLYTVEVGAGPSDMATLIASGHFNMIDLDGTYFQNGDYSFTIGDLGHGIEGVTDAVVTDAVSGKTYTFAWDSGTRLYQMTVS